MKTVFLCTVLPLLVATCPNLARAESRESMKGSQPAEREIRWAWKYLRNVVHSCLESKSECQDAEVRKALTELDTYAPDYNSPTAFAWSGLLNFVSEKNRPGLFTTTNGDAHRLATTGLVKNSAVMINTDLMDRPLEEWVGILSHEATHHLGYTDDSTRLPDRVATEIANHFKKRQSVSTLAQFQRPDIRNVIFNPTASGLAIGFFSTGPETFDIEWGQTALAQLCAPGDGIAREFVGNPTWTIEYMDKKTGVVTLRGGGFVNVMCRPNGTTGAQNSGRRAFMGATVDLQYAAPLNLVGWKKETPSLLSKGAQIGASTSPPDGMFGPNQSFWVTSVTHEASALKAGQTWKTNVTVKSADGFVPPACEIYLSGSQWPHAKHTNLPAVDIFKSCAIAKTAVDQYLLTATYDLPSNMQPDDFYISLIRFPSPFGDRFAFPQTPSYVRVENPAATKPASIRTFAINGLSPATSSAGIALANSFQAQSGQKFSLVMGVEGDQEIRDVQIDLPLWIRSADGRRFPIFANGPVADFPQIITGVRTAKVVGGSTLTIDVMMPANLSGYPIASMKFARVFFKTSDFAYAEFANPNENDSVIVNSGNGP